LFETSVIAVIFFISPIKNPPIKQKTYLAFAKYVYERFLYLNKKLRPY
jgi:hypothetical protein